MGLTPRLGSAKATLLAFGPIVLCLGLLCGCTRDRPSNGPLDGQAAEGGAGHRQARVLLLLSDWVPAADRQANLELVQSSFQAAGYGNDRLRLDVSVVSATPGQGLDQLAAVLEQSRPDVVMTSSMGSAMNLQRIGTRLPVVFAGGSDPIATCLVDSIQRPGRNASGYTSGMPIEGKMIELVADAFPAVKRLRVLVDGQVFSSAFACGEAAEHLGLAARLESEGCRPGLRRRPEALDLMVDRKPLEQAAIARGLALDFEIVCRWEDIEDAVRRVAHEHDSAIVVPDKFLFQTQSRRLADLLNRLRVPVVFEGGRYAEAGGLLAVGAWRRPKGLEEASEMARLVIEGASISSMPVRVPRGAWVWVNLNAARSSGLYPSIDVLRSADTLIR